MLALSLISQQVKWNTVHWQYLSFNDKHKLHEEWIQDYTDGEKRQEEMKKQWSEWMPRGIWYRLLFNQRRPLQSPWHTHHLLGLNTAELMLKTYCSCLWRIKHWDTWKYFPGEKKTTNPDTTLHTQTYSLVMWFGYNKGSRQSSFKLILLKQ